MRERPPVRLAYTCQSQRLMRAGCFATEQETTLTMTDHHHDHDHEHHDHSHAHAHDHGEEGLAEEQEQIAREIGSDLTEAFVDYVLGRLPFDDLVFGVFDALSDLNVVASGDYELEEMADEAAAEDGDEN